MNTAFDVCLYKFEPIMLKHKDRINSIRIRFGQKLSSHAFSSLYLWQNKMGLSVYLTEDLYCVRRTTDKNTYFFPCGTTKAKVKVLSNLMQEEDLTLQYIQNADKKFLEEHFPNRFEFFQARDDWEYIYNREEQVKLEGVSFKHLRSKVHKGASARNWSVQKLNKKNISMAAEITYEWDKEANHKGVSSDVNAAFHALKYFDELNLSGILLLEGEIPYGYAIGTVIAEDTYDLHISKTIMNNIDCYLKWELYKQLPENIRYINREEDLGIEGLRIHKTEMKPERFHELWKGKARAIH